MEVAIGGSQTFKDCKVWPGGAAVWDWNVTGTHHGYYVTVNGAPGPRKLSTLLRARPAKSSRSS